MLYAIFCADPLDPKSAEPHLVPEVQAAREAGFTPVLLDHDLTERSDPTAGLRKTRITEPGRAVYRGWMLRAGAYDNLFHALAQRGVQLFTAPQEYAACHYWQAAYAVLAPWMAKTTSVLKANIDDASAIATALAPFGSSPVIVKDWVKSQAAGYWDEACFIPNAADRDHADRVIARFRALQGDSLVGGLVFRAYLRLKPGNGPAHEFRAFVVNGRTIGCWPRSDAATILAPPPAELLDAVAARVPSPFASADFGIDEDGRW